jgi:hypothetical protein
MEAICTSETSVDPQLTTLRYIPEVDTLHNHRCENLKSYLIYKSKYSATASYLVLSTSLYL